MSKNHRKILSIVMSFILIVSFAVFSNQTQALAKNDDVKLRVFVHYPKNTDSGRKVALWCKPTTNDQISDYLTIGDHMPASGVTYKINYATKPSNLTQAQIDQAVKSSVNTWTAANPKDIFTYGGSTSATASKYDGVNALSWARLNNSALAITYSWYNTQTKELTEADTVFNTKYKWSYTAYTGSNDCGGIPGSYDLQDLTTHEFGHWAGLDDLYNQTQKDLTMYGYADQAELKKDSLGTGDILGAKAVLP